MHLLSRATLYCLLAGLTLSPALAFATNGYFLIGYGAKSRSMGGAGVAYGQDALAAAANPAAMTDVDLSGAMRIDFGVELFNPPRSVVHYSDQFNSTTGVTREKSGSNEFLIPSGGFIYKFNRKLTMGLAAIGNGANTRYNQEVPGNPTCINGDTSAGSDSYFFNFNCNGDSKTVGVNLIQMQMLPSVAFQLNKNHSIGASLAFAVQTFRAYGLGAFQELKFANSTTGVSGNGNDWSYGAGVRVGWLGKFFDQRLSLGLNYASRVYMTKFDKYNNLFAEQGGFDIPEHYAIGLAFDVTPKLTVAADIQRINYSDVASIGNPGPVDDIDFNPLCPGPDAPICKLGGDLGMGFGWNDITVYKIGFNYDINDTWSVRAGYNHGDGVINKDQVLFNMLAPATVQDHVTLGASYRPSKNVEWSANYLHAFEKTIRGTTPYRDNLPPGSENAAISMYINTFGISFAYQM